MHFRSFFLLFFAGIAASHAASQHPAEGQRFARYIFEEGLAQNTVYSVVQDPRGFMWFATEDGLHRFDGNEMKIFRAEPGQENGVSASDIFDLWVSPQGKLWIATYSGGLNSYDPATGVFRQYRHDPEDPESLADNYALSVFGDSEGYIWVSGGKALNRLDPETGKVLRLVPGETSGIMGPRALGMYEDARGTLWLGNYDGLYMFDPALEKFIPVSGDDPGLKYFDNHTVSALTGDGQGNMLAATKYGVHKLNAQRQVIDTWGPEAFGLPADTDMLITDLLVTSSGELWVATYGNGVYWRNTETGRFENYRHDPGDPRSLSDDVIMDLYEDRTGIIWIGTETGGVNKYNPATRAFRHYRYKKGDPASLPNRVVWAVLEDRKGDLWIGTDGGLSHLDRETGDYTHYRHDSGKPDSLSYNWVLDVLEDSRGRIWAGTADGISLFQPDSRNFRRYRFTENVNDVYYANSINVLFESPDGAIWAGTGDGLFRLDPETGKYEHLAHERGNPQSSPAQYLLFAAPANDDESFWVGGEGGMALFNPLTREFSRHMYGPDGKLSHQFVNAALQQQNGKLWVATAYKLNLISPDGSTRTYGVEDGLPSNLIYGVLEDGEGELWLSSNKGLSELNPDTGEVRSFDFTDGLQSDEFNAGAQFRSPSGEMFFGGINGFNAFFPSRIGRRSEPPTVAITKFFKFNEEVALDKPMPAVGELNLSWRDSVIGFEFAVFDFAAPQKNRYRYRLDGFDEKWLQGTGYSRVTYTNLDPGSYTLRVQGANSHGVWSKDEATLDISIAPPPWATWWAYTLYAIALLGISGMGLRFHFVRISERHQLENEQQKRRWAETLQQLTQALNTSLNAQEVAEELLENLRSMVAFRKAVLFLEQGVEIHVAGTKGFTDREIDALNLLPDTQARFFAEVRHARKTRVFSPGEQGIEILRSGMSEAARFIAVPAFSRSDEFAMLLIGRDSPPFSDQERDIVSAFLTQALAVLDNARLFAELQNMATTDTLTQVNNRRYFFELAELEFNRSKRYERDVALILLDADHFKEINDTYGREIGDRVLKIIASTCRSNLRHFDIIGRYGGEDFIVMLPETPVNVAADVADRLRKSVEGIRIDTHKGEFNITVSVGVAVAASDVTDLPSLINKADMALYEAKRTGRNRVVVADH